MSNHEKISIVVPVHNTQAWLENCLTSIKNQTYSDWEAILVDDGSTDKSGTICDEWASQDSRFRVNHIDNGGVANARNIGLDLVTGDFIAFCDSDDYYEPEYLEVIKLMLEQSESDLSIASLFVDRKESISSHKLPHAGVLEKQQFDTILQNWFDIAWMGLWNKLFKTDIIQQQNLRFITGLSMGEDSLFILEYIKYCERITCKDIPIYHYVQRSDGSLTHGFNKDLLRGTDLIIEKLMEVAEFFHYSTEKIRKMCIERRSMALGTYFYSAMMSEKVEEPLRREIFRQIQDSPLERRWLRQNGKLTNKVMATAPYRLCKLYFRLMKLLGH